MTHYLLSTFAGLQVLGAFATVSMIGKERKPVTTTTAGISVALAMTAVVMTLLATR